MCANFTVVDYSGENRNYKCGYCRQPSSCCSHGMWAHFLGVQDYQDLIDRGWRRSGQYCYKPNNKQTCCPSYTIKCEALELTLSKSHKKIIKRVNRFLNTGEKGGISKQNERTNVANGSSQNTRDHEMVEAPDGMRPSSQVTDIINEAMLPSADEEQTTDTAVAEAPEGKPLVIQKPTKKAKIRRMERTMKRIVERGGSVEEYLQKHALKKATQAKTLETLLSEATFGKHKLEMKLVAITDQNCEAVARLSFDLYKTYQAAIHKDTVDNEQDFSDFLVTPQLKLTRSHSGIAYGPHHHQYWLDGKLIAVGVIDILPKSVSSVYFFYDPSYSFLSLGVFSSLKEIELVRQLNRLDGNLKYYYMGFYIHSCQKMKYKGKLSPSYLLCPEVYTWHLIDEKLLLKLDRCKYQRLNENPAAVEENLFTEANLKDVLILVNYRTRLTYKEFCDLQVSVEDYTDEILEYGRLVGNRLSSRLFLSRQP